MGNVDEIGDRTGMIITPKRYVKTVMAEKICHNFSLPNLLTRKVEFFFSICTKPSNKNNSNQSVDTLQHIYNKKT